MGPVIRNRMDFLAYAGRWEEDANEVVHATTIDSTTAQARPFSAAIVTPSRVNNFTIHTNTLVSKKNSFGIEYSYTSENALNQGLQSGLDLPERAFTRSSRENVLRLSFTLIISERTIIDSRLELGHQVLGAQASSASPAVLVLDAFNAGGNQASLFSRNSNDNLQFANNVTHTFQKHTFKMGVRVDRAALRNVDRANFGGTFTFGSDFERDANGNVVLNATGQPVSITPLENYRRTLLGLRGYGPSQFSITRGNDAVGLSQWNVGWFLQDDWRASSRFTLSYGARHDFQTHLDDKLNFSPRVGIALVPDKKQKSTVRVGAGLFYSSVQSDITLKTTRAIEELRIQRPGFFPNIPTTLDGATVVLPTFYRKASDLKAPYSFIATGSYERQLPLKLYSSIGYTWQRGVNLLRTRIFNTPGAPATGSGNASPLLQYESTGKSSRHELLLALRGNLGKRVTLFSNYAFSRTRSDTDGPDTAPGNSFNLANEFGYAGNDQRHSFYFGGSMLLPWQISVSPFVLLSSGLPFNITTGRDNNGDTLFTDRPAFAAGGAPNTISTPFGIFNPNPGPGDSIIPRNFGRAPGQAVVSINFTRSFVLGLPARDNRAQQSSKPDGRRRYNLMISANIENLFNHTNFAGFNGVLPSPLFGKPNRALSARRVELGLRFSF
jgi:hypothetical protein